MGGFQLVVESICDKSGFTLLPFALSYLKYNKTYSELGETRYYLEAPTIFQNWPRQFDMKITS